jgi:hypothetical protein
VKFHNIPTLHPDEYFKGYYRRLFEANSARHELVNDWSRVMAEAMGRRNEELLHTNSFVGYSRFVNNRFKGIHTLYHEDLVGIFSYWHGTSKILESRFCQSCVHESVEQSGYAYWKLADHLPGINFCLRHHEPLAYSSEGDIFWYSPEWIKPHGFAADDQQVQACLERPHYRTYIDLSLRALRWSVPFDGIAMNITFYERFEKLFGDKPPYINDLIHDCFPPTWLAQHFPYLTPSGTKPQADKRIQRMGSRNTYKMHENSADLFLLIMATLWDSADAAIEACQRGKAKLDHWHTLSKLENHRNNRMIRTSRITRGRQFDVNDVLGMCSNILYGRGFCHNPTSRKPEVRPNALWIDS